MFDMLLSWQRQSALLETGEITKEEYDEWRYTYPQKEIERTKADLSEQRSKREAEEATDNE